MSDAFDTARKTNRKAQQDLDGVQAGKSAAAKKDPGADTSAETAARAKRSKVWVDSAANDRG